MGKKTTFALGAVAAVAFTIHSMESDEPGSSIPVRENIRETTHGVVELVTLTAEDAAVEIGPLMRTLSQEAQAGLSTWAPADPSGGTGSTLPSPVESR